MKNLTIILTAFFLVISLGLSSQDLNKAGKAYNEGINLTKENKTMEAIASYKECAEICAELGEVGEGLKTKAETQISSLYLKQGLDAYKSKDYDTAVSYFSLSAEYAKKINNTKSAAKANSYIAATYTAKGNNLIKEGKYEDAIESFNKALGYNPKYHKAYFGMAISYNKLDNTQMMEEAVKKVIEYGGDDEDVEKAKTIAANHYLNLSGICIQKESYNEAVMMSKKSIEYNYMEGTAYYYQALASNNLGNFDQAISAAETGMKAEQDDKSNLYFELGRAYEGKGEIEKACDAYKSVNSGPNVDAANYQRTTVLSCN
ncbi:MAG: tetratricopeptide repeat protein [Bacteroidales bacterium]|nr:tetratricopeptide repeat protein [Bacteroidales bacterium]